jgi:NAD(P)-dependent dehydrogenase (short-subunit alcohol dehydrogenase family)
VSAWKVALVTGGNSGIGAALVSRLVDGGAAVIAVDQGTRHLRLLGPTVRVVEIDVTATEQIDALFAMIDSDYESLDLVINCAGICGYREVSEVPAEVWSREVDVNLKGTMAVSLAAYRLMRRKGGGAIVNLGSVSAFILPPLFVPYVATKAAVIAFSRALALEARAFGIFVGVACPGNVQTPQLGAWKQSVFTPAITADDAARRILKGALKRRPMMVFPLYAKMFWYLDRLSPRILDPLRRLILSRARSRQAGAIAKS